MTEHHTFWVTGCAASVNYVAAHAWLLLLDALEDGSILDFTTELHHLVPIKNLDAAAALVGRTCRLRERPFGKEEASYYA